MEKEHIEILLEDMNSKFSLILEGHAALQKEIKGVEERLTEKIDHNTFLIGALNKKIDDVDAKLTNKIDDVDVKLTKKIDDVDAKLTKRIDEVESRLTKKIEDVETNLTERIDNVEATLTRKIDTVAADLSAHRADTEAHHGVYVVKES